MARILIIEDNEHNLYLETFILQKNGHEVIQATSGEAGITQAAQELPDLILLDIQLPGMDGYTVAEALRENPAIETIPIIAVTSYAMTGDRERILASVTIGLRNAPDSWRDFLYWNAELDES